MDEETVVAERTPTEQGSQMDTTDIDLVENRPATSLELSEAERAKISMSDKWSTYWDLYKDSSVQNKVRIHDLCDPACIDSFQKKLDKEKKRKDKEETLKKASEAAEELVEEAEVTKDNEEEDEFDPTPFLVKIAVR